MFNAKKSKIMSKTPKQLIKDAEFVLSLVYQEDIHKIESLQNVVSENDLVYVHQFEKDLDAFTLHLNKDSTAFERIEVNRWFVNGRKIAVERIKNIIDILNEF